MQRRAFATCRGQATLVCVCLAALLLLPSVPERARADDRSPWAGSRPEDLAIKLVTFGPGGDIYNYFGHNALIVQDEAQQVAHLYNFGMFSFGMDMLPSYMQGKLTFWVADTPVRATFAHYIEQNRSIRVQELNLAPQQRAMMADALATKVLPENRTYLYDHYYDNCSTRLRDLINQALGGQFKHALDRPARLNHRGHTRRYAAKDPLLDFALVFWMNDSMERPIKVWNELFLPAELELQVANMKYVDTSGKTAPLVAASYTVFEARRPPVPEVPPTTWPFMLLFGCGAGVLLCSSAWWLRRTGSWIARALFGLQHVVWGLVFGLVGTAGFLMWTLTEHVVTYRNENQLLANPLTLLLLPLGIGIIFGSARALSLARWSFYGLAAMSLALVVLKVLPSFDQDTVLTMSLLVPLNIAGALAHRGLAREPRTVASAAVRPERTQESRA